MGFTWRGTMRTLGIKGKPIEAVLVEISKITGYKGKPEEWGRQLAFDLAIGRVSVASLKASVSKAAQARAVVELQRLERLIEDALAAMERK